MDTNTCWGSALPVCKSLLSILEPGFGPLGLKTMICTDTGQVTVTNNGLSILQSLHLSHPVAKLILESVAKAVTWTGDGCKSFIMILGMVIKLLQETIEKIGLSSVSYNIASVNEYKIRLSKAIEFVQSDIIPKLEKFVQQRCCIMDSLTLKSLVSGISCSVTSSQFPPSIRKLLTDLIQEWLVGSENDFNPFTPTDHFSSIQNNERKSPIKLLSVEMSCFLIKIPGQPYTASQCMNSFIIQRDFTTLCHDVTKPVSFIVIKCDFSLYSNVDSNNMKIKLKSTTSVNEFQAKQIQVIESFVDRCTSASISLVLCSEGVPEFVQSIFQKRKISIIHHMDVDDVETILMLLEKLPICALHDGIGRENICNASICTPVSVAGRPFVHLDIPGFPRTLLLCGLSEGLVNQAAGVVSSILTSLTHCFHSDDHLGMKKIGDLELFEPSDLDTHSPYDAHNSDKPDLTSHNLQNNICFGGGLFETVVSYYFKSESKSPNHSQETKTICAVISEAVKCVPRTLFMKSSSGLRNDALYLEQTQKVENIISQLSNCEDQGQHECSSKWKQMSHDMSGGTLEPIRSKMHLLNCVLLMVGQLLGTDDIVAVKTISS